MRGNKEDNISQPGVTRVKKGQPGLQRVNKC